MLLSLQNISSDKESSLIKFCKAHKNITYVLKTVGSWDLEIEFEVRDNKEFHDAMLDLRNNFQEIIKDYESLHIFKEFKLNYFPFK